MKYILLLFITFPIFTQSINNSKPTPADTIDNSKLTVKEGKDSSQPNQNEESEDNSNLTQAEIRKKRKWELGFLLVILIYMNEVFLLNLMLMQVSLAMWG